VNWLHSDRKEAIKWLLCNDMSYLPSFTLKYFFNVTKTQIGKNRVTKGFVENVRRISNETTFDWLLPQIEVGGGADHFLCYAISIMLMNAASTLINMAYGESTEIDLEVIDQVRSKFAHENQLWKEFIQPRINLLAQIPSDLIIPYATEIAQARKLKYQFIGDASSYVNDTNKKSSFLKRKTLHF